MLGKLSVALLLAASPALAKDPAPAPEYKIKKVCRTVEVSGSFIPRTTCVNKKIPIKKRQAEQQETVTATSNTAESSTAGQKEQ